MLPTTYRGDATIDGEAMAAELQLDADDVRLTIGGGDEILRWPLTSFDVELMKEGNYRLQRGDESFLFTPAVDDGLGDEISLRRRFTSEQGSPAPVKATIADRVRDAGRGTHRRPKPKRSLAVGSLREGRDLNLATAVLILGALAVLVAAVAYFTGSAGGDPTPVVGAEAPAQNTAATTPATVAPPATTVPATTVPATTPPTAAPTTEEEVTPTTAPAPTVAPTTVTTVPVTVPTAPAGVAAFALTAEELVTRWDALAAPLSPTLVSSEVNIDSDSFNFMVGPFVRISGQMGSDGLVDRVTFAGDPSGTRDDDRDVLSALGLTVALVEPSLPPDGRRQLISSLGLDLENPVLEDLDNSFEYLGNDYTLRWDQDAALLIFHVDSVVAESDDDGS